MLSTDYLSNVLRAQTALGEHEQVPLVAVQRWSELPPGTPLFDSIVVFENYPAAAAAGCCAGPRPPERNSASSPRSSSPATRCGSGRRAWPTTMPS